MLYRRGSGVLCHISMLPNSSGIGEFGNECFTFIDWLKSSGQKYWEVLPLNSLLGRSGPGALTPYGATSSFAGNILYLSLDRLLSEGLLEKKIPVPSSLARSKNRVADYQQLFHFKSQALWASFEFCGEKILKGKSFKSFCHANEYWLNSYALFEVLSRFHFGNFDQGMIDHQWQEWPRKYHRLSLSLQQKIEKDYAKELSWVKFCQYLFFSQWQSVREYAESNGIELIGDIPIYSHTHSADTWMAPEQFQLDKLGYPLFTGGTPPDCFSQVGQNWKSPVYNWKQAKRDQFTWQRQRINHQLKLFHILRLDHFQGYITFWSIPQHQLAMNGHWEDIDSFGLFTHLTNDQLDRPLRVIVEDLGALTDKAKKIMRQFNLWGMNVLLYAFDSKDSTYLPYKHLPHSVCYVGTHDNTTALGHWQQASKGERGYLGDFINQKMTKKTVAWNYIHLALSDPSNLTILQLQDILSLDDDCRTNDPISYIKGRDVSLNWSWRLTSFSQIKKLSSRLKKKTELFGR